MLLNRRVAFPAVLSVISCFVFSLAAQNGEIFKARLTAVPADVRTRVDLTGSGAVTASLSGTKLTITGSFEGLKTPATSANLHAAVAPVAGVRGPAIADLNVPKAAAGMISASLDLTPQQVDSLRKGGLYIEIHSEKAPEGALWGWLIR